ncbi:MAG: dTMP kinase [Betaproteobacteria bacterium]|nr:dTMP kinase [Betaproteobacteria bacterium]
MSRGNFITLEGMDGAGKSTHLAWIPAFLQARGVTVTLTREPGGTALGENLRALMLDRSQRLHADTEALLMFAARREHLDKVIEPALRRGEWVVCDRFSDATFAYQSGGSGLAWERIATLETWVQGDLQPDLTLYFDVPSAVGKSRTQSVRAPDRFEQEDHAFFDRVRLGYLRRAREHPTRIAVIDGTMALENVKQEIQNKLLNI